MKRDVEKADSLLREHGSRLILFARQHVARHADAEDVVQEAFVRYWRRRAHVRDPLPYLYRCVRSVAIDTLRRRQRDEAVLDAGPDLEAFAPADERAIAADRQRQIADALDKLTAEHREIVVMRVWGDLTFDQIAEALGVAKSTAFSRHEAAMNLLRERFTETPV